MNYNIYQIQDEKFYLDYKKLALKYVSSNKKVYEFSKKNTNTKKTVFPGITKTLTDLEEILLEYSQNKEPISVNKITKPKEDKKINRGKIL